MQKQNKYNYLAVIQQHYGQGWEDVSEYETNSSYQNFEKSGIFYTDAKGSSFKMEMIPVLTYSILKK